MTQAPVVRLIDGPAGDPPLAADLYVSPSLLRPSGLVLVHGITPQGKADPQLRTAAELLARAGWAVAVPTIDGLTALRLRPDDAGPVTGATRALYAQGYRPVAMLGISLGAAPTLSAAGEPELAPALSAVLTLGGYASSRELLRYTLTGAYAFGDARGRRPVDEDGIARFARANADLVERGSRSLVDNRDPDKVDHLIDALPEDTRRLLDALSPEAGPAPDPSPAISHSRTRRSDSPVHGELAARSAGQGGGPAGANDHCRRPGSRRAGGARDGLGARRLLGRLLRVSGHRGAGASVRPK